MLLWERFDVITIFNNTRPSRTDLTIYLEK